MVDIPAHRSTDSEIAVGGSIVDRLEVPGDHDWIRVELTAGHLYVFNLSGTGDDPLTDPYLYLRDATGALLTQDDDGGSGLNSRLQFQPETTGTYYLDVGAYENRYGGSYQVDATEIDISQDIPGDRSSTTSIGIGESLVNQLEYLGDRDFIRVELTAGQFYIFELSGSGSDPVGSPNLRLRDSDGAIISSDSSYSSSTSQLAFQAPASGTYYIDVGSRATDGSGGYQLTVNEMDLSNDIPGDRSTTTSIEIGGSLVSQVEYSGDRDFIRVELTADHVYTFDLSGAGSDPLHYPYLRLRNSDGAIVGFDLTYNYNTSHLEFRAPTSGTYYIDVAGRYTENDGAYQLSVGEIDLSNDIRGDRGTTTSLAVDESLVSQLEYQGDRDFIRVELTADHVYTFDLSGAGSDPLRYPYLRLRSSDGAIVGSDPTYNYNTSHLEFRAPTSGTYYIDVSGRYTGNDGAYQLSVGEIDVSNDIRGDRGTTTSLAVDESLVSQLEYQGDRDFIRVELTAGHVYTLDLSSAGGDPLRYPYLQLRNSDGAVVDSDSSYNYFTSHLEFRAATTGTYYVDVRSHFAENDGTYRLRLGEIDVSQDIAGDSTTTATIDFGEAVTGQLEYMDDRDWYRIDLTEGQRIVITGSGTADSPILRDASGAYVAAPAFSYYNSMARFAFTPTASGTYYIDVGARDDDSRGVYGLTIIESDPIASSGNTDSVWGFNNTADTSDFDPTARVDDLVYISDMGGIDTLDLSGFAQSQRISLNPGTISSFGGGERNLEIASNTVIENAVGGSGSDTIYGNAANNVLRGNAGSDTLQGDAGDDILDGGAGRDYMSGGSGNDTYYVDFAGDSVYDLSGDDVVYAALNYVLPYSIERLVLTGAAISGTGNSLANLIVGNRLGNELDGLGGNDVLDGGAGDDVMRGGMGDDTFMVDSIGDRAIESLRGGIDTVISEVDYQLGREVENLTLAGTAIAGLGNGGSNDIRGNALDNYLDGGRGVDILRGGAGDDLYIVDDRDRVVEAAGEGVDSVLSSVSLVLSDNVENLFLRGDAVRAVGNALDNVLRGNGANNVLDGRAGADEMRGGAGDDFYFVDDAGDRVVEATGAGNDRVYARTSYAADANVEDVILRGGGAFDITGNGLDNALVGNADANRINGGAGADTMRGGGGADVFEFRDNSFAGLRPSTSDRIVDFRQGQGDRIDLDLVDADTTQAGRQDFAFIGSGAFSGAAGELRYQVINGNTYVYGDTDGDGDANFLIRLDGAYTLVGGDFIL
ncbi:pre-peptidase C-terminal domain-containing protein [Sphingomonas sabuli]|uniref:Pre-peptidase C-terminal domain-containing protein n=1 Tax=Sphingomonas sabuli TaxID=2764186 RepID=A0A7G9L5H9_9SPHN|nr:pre-peptidase C-terminal domain-containing protein [Sphingomonas sabuli]QNM83878.1 pre-peptidase C-terminal domain-containing protein [Sphingomonas sabuli]